MVPNIVVRYFQSYLVRWRNLAYSGVIRSIIIFIASTVAFACGHIERLGKSDCLDLPGLRLGGDYGRVPARLGLDHPLLGLVLDLD